MDEVGAQPGSHSLVVPETLPQNLGVDSAASPAASSLRSSADFTQARLPLPTMAGGRAHSLHLGRWLAF